MPAINRNVTRTIKNSSESTYETQSIASSALAFNLTTSDKFYIGFNEPFTTRYLYFSVPNDASHTVTIKYWDGTQYSAVSDLVDQTSGLTQSGFISWKNSTDWKKHAQSGITEELYWIEMTVGDSLDADCALQSVLNLFCDQTMLRAYYPELVSDASYLPPSRTDFTEQLLAAKDMVVQRLKKDKIIEDESEVIDINEVAISAVHATAYIILLPLSTLAGDDTAKERTKAALDSMNYELNEVKLDLDIDNSGVIEDDEKEIGNVVYTRGT